MTQLRPGPRLPEHLLSRARLLPDRLAVLPLLPQHKVIVEVGVALGDFSEHMLNVCQPRHFLAIDTFRLHEIPALWGRSTRELFNGGTHGAFYRNRFADAIRRDLVTVLEGDSAAMLESLDDASVDIVYVDADHTYESVRRELGVISRKVRDDGYIILNDYIMTEAGFSNDAYGVIQATNEFMIAENWEMIYFALQPYMFCDVVLRRASEQPVPALNGGDALARCVELEMRNAELEQGLAAMRGSTSWRVTAPLRALRRIQTRSMRHG